MTDLNRFSRDNFFDVIQGDSGSDLYDTLSFRFNNFFDFIKDRSAEVFTITSSVANAPDLISYLKYGTHQLWWVICVVNKIQDPLTELIEGRKIALPLREDIEEFYQEVVSGSTDSDQNSEVSI